MFIGYFSSFFIALLLSLFYLGYAASGLVAQIRKEVTVKPEKPSCTVLIQDSKEIPHFVFDYIADVPKPDRQVRFAELIIDIPVADDSIPVQKICLSEYFLRPPPTV
ncbi:MAG: hypothetical protein LBQ01_05800 [Prevotellaceae bacterium]|nr:hypothetical protein [Prevotellaceae bacterium]